MFNKFFYFADASETWQLTIQDPASPALEGMIYFHNFLNFFLIIIGTCVCFFLLKIIFIFNKQNNVNSIKFTHSNLLEIIWTIIPAFILVLISIPSFSLLYSLDEILNTSLSLKIVGHQWFWSYEYSDTFFFNNTLFTNDLLFDSYIIETNDLVKGLFRLLEVDNRTVLPINTNIRLLLSSSDVLHSWCVPSLGIKIDACPGRLSEISTFIKRKGVFFGQCSEICGINHGFMPIVVVSTSKANFIAWRNNQIVL